MNGPILMTWLSRKRKRATLFLYKNPTRIVQIQSSMAKGKYCILKKGKCPSGKNLLFLVHGARRNVNYWASSGVWKGRTVERGEFRGLQEAAEEVLLLRLIWLLSLSKRMRLFAFHKLSLPVLTIYVTIGSRAFSHGRLIIFSRFKLQKYVEIDFLIFK